MRKRKSKWTLFGFCNGLLLIALALLCLLPMIYVVAVSFSTRKGLIDAGFILVPREFTTAAYEYCLNTSAFM
ncbi:MAG: carbohydrate ABC transporter permease, partial [Roseburia sp.]|nr:carbohydrate ABC transporter permease [Roseburia sp.]